MPVMVFVKNLRSGNARDPKLEDFLNQVKDPRSGITLKYYDNAVDFGDKVKDAIVKSLVRKFLDAPRLIERLKECEANLSKRTDELPISVETAVTSNPERPVSIELGKGDVILEIPPRIKRGETITVSATFRGTGNKGFLDLLVVDPDGNQFWYPDPKSWNSVMNSGNVVVSSSVYSSQWHADLPQPSKLGEYTAFVGFYEDTLQLPTTNRRLVAYTQRNFHVVE